MSKIVSPDTLLRCSVLVLAAALILSGFGKYDWKLDLLSHWRSHYVLAACVLLPLLLIRRHHRYAGLTAILVLLNVTALQYPTVALAGTQKMPAVEPRYPLRMAAFNVLYKNNSYDTALAWLRG